MAKKNILNEEGPEVREERPAKKVVRLRNADIVELIEGLHNSVSKERNLRAVRENVIERENAFQLDGIMGKLKAMALQFKLFTSLPKAQ